MATSKKKTAEEKFSDKEAKRRFEAALLGARVSKQAPSKNKSSQTPPRSGRRREPKS